MTDTPRSHVTLDRETWGKVRLLAFQMNQPAVRMLDRLIAAMKRRPGVWFPTCETVARYCLEQFPPGR